jgi:arylsulfatase A-like enzyme
MNRRNFLGITAALPALAQRNGKPNVVVILADDLGWQGLSSYGCTDIQTPNIDRIGKEGARFTNAYVSCPVCSPTRAGLMTGRYQQRFGHEFNPGPAALADEKFGLPLSETTIADRLKALGYATGIVGKWHLGYQPQYHPQKRGFDEFYGFLGGAHSYADVAADPANPILRGTERAEKEDYLTEAFARECVAFIAKNRTRPFFLYAPFNAVHAPMQLAPVQEAALAEIKDPRRRVHASMLISLDNAVGRILGALDEHKLAENTLVVFLSDNGGPTRSTTSSNLPLRDYKGNVYEGGIRVPFMTRWPGRIRAGQVLDQPVIALDILPTAVEAAGGKSPAKLDGVSLLPVLTGKSKNPPHERLYWRFGERAAMRDGDWKLVRIQGGPDQLYNLKSDVSESRDMAAAEPERLKTMQAAFETWNAQLAKPLWERESAAAQKKKNKKI